MNCPTTFEDEYAARFHALCKKEGRKPLLPGSMDFSSGWNREVSEKLEERKGLVLEQIKTGKPQREIALFLKIPVASVKRDVRALKDEGRL
jgi:DNA-binding NarL/FixJ family response regulator